MSLFQSRILSKAGKSRRTQPFSGSIVQIVSALVAILCLLPACQFLESEPDVSQDAATKKPTMPDSALDSESEIEKIDLSSLRNRSVTSYPLPARLGSIKDLFLKDNKVILATGTGFHYQLRSVSGQKILIPTPEIIGRSYPKFPVQTYQMLAHSRPGLGHKNIQAAWLIKPIGNSRHSVFGKDINSGGGFLFQKRNGQIQTLILNEKEVFTDLAPRVVDLDADGQEELVLIKTDEERGTTLNIYSSGFKSPTLITTTQAIGNSDGWLNPVGFGDFDGDGNLELAYIQDPHDEGVLRLLNYDQGQLTELAAQAGYSNHKPASPVLELSVVVDWNGDGRDEIAVPLSDRMTLTLCTLANGSLHQIGSVKHQVEITTAIIAHNIDDDALPELIYGLADGQLMIIDD